MRSAAIRGSSGHEIHESNGASNKVSYRNRSLSPAAGVVKPFMAWRVLDRSASLKASRHLGYSTITADASRGKFYEFKVLLFPDTLMRMSAGIQENRQRFQKPLIGKLCQKLRNLLNRQRKRSHKLGGCTLRNVFGEARILDDKLFRVE